MRIGARSSPLSRAQVEEVLSLLPNLEVQICWVITTGDRDKTTSLRTLGKSDFFTKELDEMLLKGEIDAAIHSAKDLPEPLPQGLVLAALTKGVDPRDSLVFQKPLAPGALIATSSERREEQVRALYPDVRFTDLRGTIGERLAKIESGEIDGAVIAEAALIRLKLNPNRVILPGETASLQGRLAIITREADIQAKELFHAIDSLSGASSPC